MIKRYPKRCLAFFILLLLIVKLDASAQASKNINLLGHHVYDQPYPLSALWGYTDPQGREYALVGLYTGFSILDVTDPTDIQELYFIPGGPNIWREMKTWGHYAYGVSEIAAGPSVGLTIIDLSNLPGTNLSHTVINVIGTDTIGPAHTIWIDEHGHCFLYGAQVALGADAGCLVLDLSNDPLQPTVLGHLNHVYYHDGHVRGDTLWAAAMGNGTMEVYDVSDWASPFFLGSVQTPGSFTHNTAISEDGKVAFTTDEVPDGYITAYDVSDLSNIQELGRVQMDPAGSETPHNVHYLNGWLPTAYYREGVVIFDAHDPTNMVVTGYYDTFYPDDTLNSFQGVWEAYAKFPSGRIIAGDIQNGLFVLEPTYVRACYLQGTVTDSISGETLPGVQVHFSGLMPGDTVLSKITGVYKTGTADSGSYTVTFTKTGYFPKTFTVNVDHGQVTTLDAQLVRTDLGFEKLDVSQIQIWPVPSVSQLNVSGIAGIREIRFLDENGKVLSTQKTNQATQLSLDISNYAAGSYYLEFIGSKGSMGLRSVVVSK